MYTHAYIYVPSTGDWGGWGWPVTSRWELSDISVLRGRWQSSLTSISIPPWRVGLPGGHRGGSGPVPEAVGTARLLTVPRSAQLSSGRPGPSHTPPVMWGCSWELSTSVTSPLQSEVGHPPRPGPAFLMGSQHKQGARGQGKFRGPRAPAI